MPWQEKNALSERLKFVHLCESKRFTMSELCHRFGIARPTGYLWLERYQAEGEAGLVERSRRPTHSPHQTQPELEAAIVQLREKHRDWGPVTLISYLRKHFPNEAWPAASTAGRILRSHDLVKPRTKRRKPRHPGRPYLAMQAANDVWCADFKGEFKTLDGRYCYPLTITDGCSRYLLACRARRRTTYEAVKPVFEETFRKYGLPHQMLTDSGVPFSSVAICGLSRLAIWWIKLGIHPVRIQPGHPEQNGRHERMHRTLGSTTRPPAANLGAQQRRFSRFTDEYNETRPHRALQGRTPAELFSPSTRRYPTKTPELSYEPHFEVRKVSGRGCFSWHDTPVRLSKTFSGEYVGLEPIEEHRYRVYFGPVLLGVFDERAGNVLG